jgi:prepilin-type N-terminal cleavage/methylation domain-containing protein
MKSGQLPQGFTLVELLTAVILIGVLALVLIPFISAQNPTKLDLAAAEVGNALRFAMSEAERTGGYVLVDGSAAGRLQVLHSDAAGASLGAVTDPLTKRALEIDTSSPGLSGEMSMTPQFFKGATAYPQLLIGPGTQMQAFDKGNNKGALDAGSGIVLTLGSQSITVGVNATTGLVTVP